MQHVIRELAEAASSGYNNTTYDACAKPDDEEGGMNVSVMLGVLIAFVASSARPARPRARHAVPHQPPALRSRAQSVSTLATICRPWG